MISFMRLISSGCNPMLGSSIIYTKSVNGLFKCRISLIRCDSPPDKDLVSRDKVR